MSHQFRDENVFFVKLETQTAHTHDIMRARPSFISLLFYFPPMMSTMCAWFRDHGLNYHVVVVSQCENQQRTTHTRESGSEKMCPTRRFFSSLHKLSGDHRPSRACTHSDPPSRVVCTHAPARSCAQRWFPIYSSYSGVDTGELTNCARPIRRRQPEMPEKLLRVGGL